MPHELLSLALFMMTFGALMSTDVLLHGLLAPMEPELYGLSQLYSNSWLTRGWNWLSAPRTLPSPAQADGNRDESHIGCAFPSWRTATIASTVFAILAAAQLLWAPSVDTAQARTVIERGLALAEQDMPSELGPWRLTKFDAVERDSYSDFGKYSRTYTYLHADRPELVATVSLDFPYLGGWHDLCMCYRGGGWTTAQRTVAAQNAAGDGWEYVDARLRNEAGSSAIVFFAGFDVSGAAAEPPSEAVLFRPWFRLRRRLLHQLAPQLLQVQVFAAGDAVENAQVQSDLSVLFAAARERFRQLVIK